MSGRVGEMMTGNDDCEPFERERQRKSEWWLDHSGESDGDRTSFKRRTGSKNLDPEDLRWRASQGGMSGGGSAYGVMCV